jgi:outer membrane protein assembly factor BamB
VSRGFLKKTGWAAWLCLLLGLSACTTIEHRSERVPVAPLPPVIESASSLLSPLWQRALGSRFSCQQTGLSLVLAVRDDRLFTVSCDGHIWSLDAENGEILWERHLKTPITAGPSVSDSLLVVATKAPAVLALDPKTGDLLWTKPENREILAPITIVNNTLFSHSLDDTVVARHAKGGEIRWQFQNPPLNMVLRKNARPMPFGKEIVVGFADGKLMAFKQDSGALTWMQELSIPIGHDEFQRMVDVSAEPLVDGDRIFAVNFQGSVNALEAASGEKIWSKPASSFTGLAIHQQYLVLSDSQGTVLAFNKKTGQTLWTQTGLQGRRLSAPAVTARTVFLGDEQGYLHVLRLDTGEYLTRIKVSGSPIESAPVMRGERLFVLSQGSVVSAYVLPQAGI